MRAACAAVLLLVGRAAGAAVTIELRADRPEASAGDVVTFTATVANGGAALAGARVRLTPARGLALAHASIGGPFDLPAGGSLAIRYEVAVESGVPAGRYATTAAVIAADGSMVSGEASASVRVGADPFLDEGLILGRVRCDGGRGIYGARVYIDTGSYARTDTAGAYHLSRIPAGLHLVKLDEATLPPGATLVGDPARTVNLTRGLALRMSFAARCPELARVVPAEVELAPGTARPPASLTVSGSLETMTAAVDGKPLALPEAQLALAPGRQLLPGASANLRPQAPVPFAVALRWPSGGPRSYTLTIARSGRILRSLKGDGPPPPTVVWDGRGDDGRPAGEGLFDAQLRVVGADLELAASARLRFGVGYGLGPGREQIRVLRGDFFAGPELRPQATPALERALAEVARDADGGFVLVEVHDDGAGDGLEKLARTQKQAEVVRARLEASHVSVQARGRGNLAVLEPGAAAKNRRIVVKIAMPGAGTGTAVPPPPPGLASALLDGQPAVVERGRFARNLPVPPDGKLLVDLAAADGRQAVGVWRLGAATSDVRPLPARLEPGPTPIAGDLADGSLTVGGRSVDTTLMEVDLAVRTVGKRVELAPVLPPGLQIAAWELATWTTDFEREPRRRIGGQGGPPAVIPSDGAGARTLFRLTIEDPLGNRGESPVHVLSATGFGAVRLSGALFTAAGDATPAFRRALAAFVSSASGRPSSERYLLEATVVTPKELNAAEAKLALATRTGRVKELLGELRGRVDVALTPGTRPSEQLDITAQMVARPPPARALVDGKELPLDGTRFSASVPVATGSAVVVELRAPTGHVGRFVVGERPPAAPIAKVGDLKPPETPPPAPFNAEPGEFGAAELQAALGRAPTPVRGIAAADLEVRLPARDARLASGELWIPGRTAAGNRVAIAGRPVDVRADGSFDALVELPPGASTLVVEATDPAGNRARVTWPVRVAEAQQMLLVLAEGVIGNARLDGMTADSMGHLGDDFLVHARVAAYYKARFTADGPFKNYELVAALDTAKIAEEQPFFQQLIDPVRSFGAFGDSAEEVKEANARGKLYVRLRADDSLAQIGDFGAEIGGARDLLRYERTVYGAGVDVRRGGTEVKAFAAPDLVERLARDVNVFRATGGSLYYLRHGHVIPGGERLRVVVRDRDTNMVVSDRLLVRDVDYRLDAPGGRIQLVTPLASEADAAWGLANVTGASLAPTGGHPVFLEAEYEYEPDQATTTTAAGAWIHDAFGPVEVAGGAVGESRAGADYSLFGAQATLHAGAATTVRLEIARSQAADAASALSADGGLSFQDAGFAGSGGQLGWRASLESDPGPAHVRLYAQGLDDGFRSTGTLLEQGHRKIGGLAALDVRAGDTVTVRADTDHAGDATAQLETVRYEHRGPVGWLVEAGHQDVPAAERWGAALAASWQATKRLVLRARQEVQTDGVATTAGADVQLAPRLFVSAAGTVRWNGDTAVAAGFKTPVDDTAAMYVTERLEGRSGRLVATSIVGGEERLGAGGRAYGEYQLENGASADRGRAVLGLGHRIALASWLKVDGGYEHQESLGAALPDGTPAGRQRRDLVRAGAEFLHAAVKATAQIELRLDDGGAAPLVPLPASGSPLVLPPGQRRQVVAGAAAEWKWTAEQTFLARFRIGDTQDTDRDARVARYLEATAGWALRPLELDWLDLVVHYSYLYDQRPDVPGVVERAHVIAAAPIVDLPGGLQLAGKLVWKRTTDVDAWLGLVRLGFRLRGRWDVAVEARALRLVRPDGDDTETGALVEVAYDLSRVARVGAGYNFSHFSDDELADLAHDGHGFFIRVVGRY